MSCLPPAIIASVLEAGLLAPSADNQHLLEFQSSFDTILLLGNGEYCSAPPHRKILSLISFGAVVENMVIRAASLGYSATVTWSPGDAQPSPIASLHFALDCGLEMPALDAAIPRRHTNRRVAFHGPPLAPSALADLRSLAAQESGVSLSFLDRGAARGKLLHLLVLAESERFNNRGMHEELFGSIRFDVGWHRSASVGLAPATLCVEPGLRWAFTSLRHWPVMNTLRRLGAHRLLALRSAYLPCARAPHLGVLTTRVPLPLGAVRVGRALQRVWLASESMGMAFQPFAAPALLALAESAALPPKFEEALRHGWSLLTDETPMMVFRLGRAREPSIKSGRLTVEHHVQAKNKLPS